MTVTQLMETVRETRATQHVSLRTAVETVAATVPPQTAARLYDAYAPGQIGA